MKRLFIFSWAAETLDVKVIYDYYHAKLIQRDLTRVFVHTTYFGIIEIYCSERYKIFDNSLLTPKFDTNRIREENRYFHSTFPSQLFSKLDWRGLQFQSKQNFQQNPSYSPILSAVKCLILSFKSHAGILQYF